MEKKYNLTCKSPESLTCIEKLLSVLESNRILSLLVLVVF